MYRKKNFKCTFIFSLLIVAVSFFDSCKKKETDMLGPIVTITAPAINQSFNVFDLITVHASLSDDTKITAVSVSIVNDQYTPVVTSVSVPVTSPTMTLNTTYYIDNIHLLSGTYYLLITATDGTNDSHAYQKIYINAVPKTLKKIFVTSSTNSSQTNLSYIDSTFTTIVPYHNFSGDYISSSVSSYYQQAYMCGYYTGNFQGITLNNNAVKFTVTPLITSEPYFTGFYNDDMNNYVARYDGHIKGYDYLGNPIYSATATGSFYPTKFCFNNNYLIAEEIDKTSSAKKLATYYPTGSPLQEVSITQDVVAFCEKDFENVFVFGNVSGLGIIQLFNRTTNNLWSPYPYSLGTGSILSALKIDDDTYLIGYSNGTILKYQYQNSSVTNYLTGYTAIQLKYDDVNNRIIVVEANRITAIDYPTAVLVKTINSSETILGVNLLYNR